MKVRINKLFYLLIFILVPTILYSCNEPSSNGQIEDLPPTPNLTPDAATIELIYPAEVTTGDIFKIEIQNNSPVTYAYIFPSNRDNCLSLKQNNRNVWSSRPECDVLAEIILRPGDSHTIGTWDLQLCADSDCLTQETAVPGQYDFEIPLYPHWGTDEVVYENPVIKTASFNIIAP